MTWLTRRDQYHQRSPPDAWKFGFFQLAYRTDIKGQLGESMAGGEGTGRGGEQDGGKGIAEAETRLLFGEPPFFLYNF
jgi:hypothetical protein